MISIKGTAPSGGIVVKGMPPQVECFLNFIVDFREFGFDLCAFVEGVFLRVVVGDVVGSW